MRINAFEKGLDGRVAIVTGAAIGNGRAFCERLAQEGAIVVIADIADASATLQAVQESGGTGISIKVDVTNPAEVQNLVNETLQQFGRIDILVHNVGLYEEEPFELISAEQWKTMFDVNVNSLFYVTQAVLPAMKEAGYGRIITMSSDTVWLGTPYLTHYVATKMGIIGFTRSLAAEIGKYGITINAITVGLTATQQPNSQKINSSILEHIIPAQAVRRSDEPEDIANVVAFLSLPASGIITDRKSVV